MCKHSCKKAFQNLFWYLVASYFLASSWDLNPSEITLGSIITDVEYGNKFSVGLFSTFIQLVTAGFEASHSSKSSSKLEYSYQSMETQRFTPSEEFIAKAAADGAVKSRLKIWGGRAKIFVVTGVKIAKGVTIATIEEAEKDATLQVGVEIPTPQAHTQRVEGPIVFAFQVERLRLPWKGEPISERYVDGAVLGQRDTKVEYMFEVSDVCLDDEEMEHIGLEARDITDEDALGQKESDLPLGSVIADVTTLERINPNENLSIPIDTETSTAELSCEGGFIRSGGYDNSRYSAFRRLIPGYLMAPLASESVIDYDIDWIEARYFKPSAKFIAKAAADPAVKSRFEIGDSAKVFVVTGVMTAREVTIQETHETKEKIRMNVKTDIEDPPILAFQVNQLTLTSDGEPTIESYADGAVFEQG
ncbi:hypothetical protein V8C34DRAFT_327949 [Trichoderma compactum]